MLLFSHSLKFGKTGVLFSRHRKFGNTAVLFFFFFFFSCMESLGKLFFFSLFFPLTESLGGKMGMLFFFFFFFFRHGKLGETCMIVSRHGKFWANSGDFFQAWKVWTE